MNVSDEYTAFSEYKLQKAVLIYKTLSGNTLCTVNGIKENKGKTVIQQGTPINTGNLAEIFSMCGTQKKSELKKLQWKNERILAEGPGSVLWYTPAKRREIFFSCNNSKLMKVSGKEFPFPALLFMADKNTLKVFVLKSSSKRPTRATELYQAPFWNCSATGSVCLPNGARNQNHTPEEWEEIFFKSAFSHSGGAKFKTGTIETVFPQLIKNPKSKFPVKNCHLHKFKVGDLLEGKTK